MRTIHGVGYAFNAAISDMAAAPEVAAWLVSLSGRTALPYGHTVIGREGDDVLALASPTTSRRHARLEVSGGQATVEDLGSKNGTVVEGCAASRLIDLNDGDSVRAGGVELTYRRQTADQPTATLAAS